LRGRAYDLIKIGQWSYPLEVELLLTDHPRHPWGGSGKNAL